MSDFVTHTAQRARGMLERNYDAEVINIHHQANGRTLVNLANGRSGVGTCLGCGSAPCMEKEESELTLFGALEAFPGDPSRDVCPTKAIVWDREQSAALVMADDCIGCGLCVRRCPYGAISLTNGLVAIVETSDPDSLIYGGALEIEHLKVAHSGQIAELDAPAAVNLLTSIGSLNDGRTNIFIRNLLNEIGFNARTRRRGDTNMRIDAVGFSNSGRPFVAEIETGLGVLESPRALLEDVAVLHSRYGYQTEEIDPISIILALPNIRSEYYQVIRDIEKSLGLRCRTITVGLLVALMWNFMKLDSFKGRAFTVGEGSINITDHIGVDIEKWPEPYPGAFKPVK